MATLSLWRSEKRAQSGVSAEEKQIDELMNTEERRLLEVGAGKEPWKKWGPCLSQRQLRPEWQTCRMISPENPMPAKKLRALY